MSDDAVSLVFNLIFCLASLAIPAGIAFGIWRMNKASKARISDDECVACGSKDVTIVAEGAYRCNACGYEGGSGLAKLQDKARLDAILAMSDDDKRRSGIQDLTQARSLLLGAQGTLAGAATLSVMDLTGVGSGDRGQSKQSELVSAVKDMMEAQQHVRDAAIKLGQNATYHFDIDFDPATFALDVTLDSLIAGVVMHAKIEEARGHCSRMLSAVEGALARVPQNG